MKDAHRLWSYWQAVAAGFCPRPATVKQWDDLVARFPVSKKA